jgi:hypothetical protein
MMQNANMQAGAEPLKPRHREWSKKSITTTL